MPDELTESIVIAAPQSAVFQAIRDVCAIGGRSPECTGVTMHRPELPIGKGSRFTGHNRNGLRRWSTRCTVTAAEPDRCFTFEVDAVGLAVSRWSYTLEPVDGGAATIVRETWTDRRSPLMWLLSTVVTGVADRRSRNRQSIQDTLRALKADLERQAGTGR